jgi:integrase
VSGDLRLQLAEYLALRRALGYRLARPEKLLTQFLDYLDAAGESLISVRAALDWARSPDSDAGSNWPAYRLSTVRGFATYLHAIDPAHEVPTPDLLPQRPHRASPYLYSTDDIAAVMTAAQTLKTPWRRCMVATLIGMLAVTGMRVGEAIALDAADVDLTTGRVVIRHGKFDKARELHLHPTAVTALSDYLRARAALKVRPTSPALFVSAAGTRLVYCNVWNTFHRLTRLAGLPGRSGNCRPRIHDLRHSFAVATMLDAYAAGQDAQAQLSLLSTWMGHVHPGNTYWYLSASPELMAAAGTRLETYLADKS